MRPYLYEPQSTRGVQTALQLAGVHLPVTAIERWSPMEQLIAYDWAWRKHLNASDHHVRQRARPLFVGTAEAAAAMHLGARVRATYDSAGGVVVAEGILCATRGDGTIQIRADSGEMAYCWPLLTFARVPGAHQEGHDAQSA